MHVSGDPPQVDVPLCPSNALYEPDQDCINLDGTKVDKGMVVTGIFAVGRSQHKHEPESKLVDSRFVMNPMGILTHIC